jgi:hypothetical protein
VDALQKGLAAGNTTALNTFREEVAQQGTPLIEPIPDNDKHSLLTFL